MSINGKFKFISIKNLSCDKRWNDRTVHPSRLNKIVNGLTEVKLLFTEHKESPHLRARLLSSFLFMHIIILKFLNVGNLIPSICIICDNYIFFFKNCDNYI